MKTKHTAGPWLAHRQQFEIIINTGHPKSPTIGSVFVNLIPSEEAEANARLIAAAPEMLEALRKAESLLTHLEVRGDCIRAVRDAINKATQP